MRRRPDHELIALARKGSSDAAGVLFDRYWALAWKAAYAVTVDRELANDAAQEGMQRALSKLARFDETRPFAPWVKRIAINCALDQRRRVRRHAAIEAELHTWSVSEAAEVDLRLWGVGDAVAALGEAKRMVVVLHYWLDLPVEEIAGVLGLPVGTVASRLSRALAELREVLEEEHVAGA
jgi:RNA polymerase sigma-70 factor (ECF subfamily)